MTLNTKQKEKEKQVGHYNICILIIFSLKNTKNIKNYLSKKPKQ